MRLHLLAGMFYKPAYGFAANVHLVASLHLSGGVREPRYLEPFEHCLRREGPWV